MRKPVISHTFNGLEITALILDISTREQIERVYYVARTPPAGGEKKRDDHIRKVIESQLLPHEKYVVALKIRQKPRRYYMDEDEFVKQAHEAPLLKTSKYIKDRTES